LGSDELREIQKRATYWMTRSPEAKADMEGFIHQNALVLIQLYPLMAVSNLGSRTGLEVRFRAIEGFFDVAVPMLAKLTGSKPLGKQKISSADSDPSAPNSPFAKKRVKSAR